MKEFSHSCMRTCLLILTFFGPFSIGHAEAQIPAPAWSISSIVEGGQVGRSTAIAVDSKRNSHVVYYDFISKNLVYGTNSGNTWSFTAIDNSMTVWPAWSASIAIGPDDKIHIVYGDWTNGILKYATNVTGDWVVSSLYTGTPGTGIEGAISVDAVGNVHICYGAHDGLKYLTKVSGLWISTTIDTGSNNLFISMAVDSGGKIHVSYTWQVGFYNEIRYATNASGQWITSAIGNNGDRGFSSSLAIDSADRIHVSYYDFVTAELKYAVMSPGQPWAVSVVDSPGNTGGNGLATSIALDSRDRVHLSYYDFNNRALRYGMKSANSPWILSTIDGNGDSGAINTITVDSRDRVHIGYLVVWSTSSSSFNYAHTSPWWTSIVDDSGDTGRHTSVAVDSNSKVHISYFSYIDGVSYATNASGAWVTSMVDSSGGLGDTSIALDVNNKAHISYYAAGSGNLKYATNAWGPWAVFTIDSEGDVGAYNDIALDAADKVYISYYDSSNGDLKYATNVSGSWQKFKLDSSGDVGRENSIAVDMAGNVHISYWDLTRSIVKYTTNSLSQGWTTVDVAYGVGGTAIAVDWMGWVHISCFDSVISHDLKYLLGYRDILGTWNWTTETVEHGNAATSVDALSTSIAADALHRVHISYFGAGDYKLKYATNIEGPWSLSTVEPTDFAGIHNSIALDSRGGVYISYNNAVGADLRITKNVNDYGKIGVFRNGMWYVDTNGSGAWEKGEDASVGFGLGGDIPLAGNWNGIAGSIGTFRTGKWYLDMNGNRRWDGCGVDYTCNYKFGLSSDAPLAGDWDGDWWGLDEIGVFRGGKWYLDYDGNGLWDGCSSERCYSFGLGSDIPLTGDWNGDGKTEIGVKRGANWYLDYNSNGVWDGCRKDRCFFFGLTTDVPTSGDWNGDGFDEIGVFRGGKWYLDNGNGRWDGCSVPNNDSCFSFGLAVDMPVQGAW